MNDLLILSTPSYFEHPPCSGIYTACVKVKYLLEKLKIPNIQRELDLEFVCFFLAVAGLIWLCPICLLCFRGSSVCCIENG